MALLLEDRSAGERISALQSTGGQEHRASPRWALFGTRWIRWTRSPNERLQGSPAPALSHAEIRSIILGVLLAMLLAALDQTIIATALPTIGRELGDLEHLPWIVTVYLLTSTAVTPLYGKFSDSHGRRVTMLIGIAIFIVGSVACALAPTMFVLILARGLQGLGGGGLISLAQTIIADHRAAAGARALPGLFRQRLHDLEPARAGARRLLRRAPALVGDLLDQPAARPRSRSGHRVSQPEALPRHDRPHRLDLLGAAPAGGGHRRSASGPELGRDPLSLGAPCRCSGCLPPRSRSGVFSPCACAWRPSR